MISQLRAAHAADSATASGVDVITGGVGDMSKLGIYESFRVSTRRGCRGGAAQQLLCLERVWL